MAANETSICNLALGKLGSERIMSLDDASQAARFSKLFYEQTRDEVLRSHRWNFAIARQRMVRLSENPPFGWAFQYELPNDCLRMLQLNGYEPWEQPDLFEIEGRMLLTDEDTAEVKFITRVTDPNLFDPLFIEALVVKLASRLAQPLTGSRTLPGELTTEYERLTSAKARRMDAVEGRSKRKLPYIESDLVNSRR